MVTTGSQSAVKTTISDKRQHGLPQAFLMKHRQRPFHRQKRQYSYRSLFAALQMLRIARYPDYSLLSLLYQRLPVFFLLNADSRILMIRQSATRYFR